MQLKSLYLTAAVLASLTFHNGRADAQTPKPETIMGTVTELRLPAREFVITNADGSTLPVKVSTNTTIRRYGPDSVTVAQAVPSGITAISAGDQIRARGEKSSDGLTMTADEVVFGTFWTKGGTITAIDPSAHAITIQEVGTNQPLVVRVAAESQLKMLPDMHPPEGSATGSHEGTPDHVPTTPHGAVDMAKVLSMMPVCKMDDLKVGGAVLVSGTKGATAGTMSAIMLLANADMFVRLMQQQAEGNGAGMEHLLRMHGWNPALGLRLPAIPE